MFRYKSEEIGVETMVAKMNTMAEQGWRVVSVFPSYWQTPMIKEAFALEKVVVLFEQNEYSESAEGATEQSPG